MPFFQSTSTQSLLYSSEPNNVESQRGINIDLPLESLWSRNGYEERDLKSNCKLGVRRVIIHVLLSPSSWGTKGQVVRRHTVPYSAIVTCDDKDHEPCSQTYLIFWLHQGTNYVTLGNVISWDLHLLLWKMGRVRVATCIHFLRLSLEMTTTSVT